MQEPQPQEVTHFLEALRGAETDRSEITNQVFELLYNELRALAGSFLHRERDGHTLQPTALVHEAFARLVDQSRIDWQGRAHFLGIAGQAMRRVLIDYARMHNAEKRGGGLQRIPLTEIIGTDTNEHELIDLNSALTKLAEQSERAAQVAELKVFGGLSGDEIAEFLSVSRRTVTGDWTLAKMWLARELAD